MTGRSFSKFDTGPLEEVFRAELALLSDDLKAELPDAKAIAAGIGKAAWSQQFHLLDELRHQVDLLVEKQRIARVRQAAETFRRVLQAAIATTISLSK